MIRQLAVAMVMLAIFSFGCASTFHEAHYFKSGTASASVIPNYYRLTVKGYSWLSSSRYISGYFDEDTLNTYFNEYTQPAGAAITPSKKPPVTKAPAEGQNTSSSEPAAKAPAAENQNTEPVAKELRGKRLIMILSSNSDEIATQIGALAASKQFTASLVGLLARDQYAAADAADSRLAIEKSRAKTTASLASQVVSGLPDNATEAVAKQTLLAFVNSLASDLGHQGAFDNLDSAAQWLDFNRARLVKGEQ